MTQGIGNVLARSGVDCTFSVFSLAGFLQHLHLVNIVTFTSIIMAAIAPAVIKTLVCRLLLYVC